MTLPAIIQKHPTAWYYSQCFCNEHRRRWFERHYGDDDIPAYQARIARLEGQVVSALESFDTGVQARGGILEFNRPRSMPYSLCEHTFVRNGSGRIYDLRGWTLGCRRIYSCRAGHNRHAASIEDLLDHKESIKITDASTGHVYPFLVTHPYHANEAAVAAVARVGLSIFVYRLSLIHI